MSKIVFIKDNSLEIRNKLKETGFSICACAELKDSIWLVYSPNVEMQFDIHGEGYADEGDFDEKYSPSERINIRLKTNGYYPEEREFYETIEEFLEKYHK